MSSAKHFLPARKPETFAECREHRETLQSACIRYERQTAALEEERDRLAALNAELVKALERFVALTERGDLRPQPRVYLDSLLSISNAALAQSKAVQS